MTEVRVAGMKKHSSVNGPGIRFVVFMQGCPHHCPGCQNPETHDMEGGILTDTEEVLVEISGTKYLDGVTISGGDPMAQPEALYEISRGARDMHLGVWVYTGWTYEQIMAGQAGQSAIRALRYVDVLVDGKYIEARSDANSIWRGSSNQRLIDVQESLRMGRVVSLTDLDDEDDYACAM